MKSFAAKMLLPLLFAAAGLLSSVVGGDLAPICIALVHGGWAEAGSLPRSYWVFLEPPQWLLQENESMYGFVKIGSAFLALAILVVTVISAARLWHYIVVVKYKWLTPEEAREFSKRDPGF
jgi:hypothetical protein